MNQEGGPKLTVVKLSNHEFQVTTQNGSTVTLGVFSPRLAEEILRINAKVRADLNQPLNKERNT